MGSAGEAAPRTEACLTSAFLNHGPWIWVNHSDMRYYYERFRAQRFCILKRALIKKYYIESTDSAIISRTKNIKDKTESTLLYKHKNKKAHSCKRYDQLIQPSISTMKF